MTKINFINEFQKIISDHYNDNYISRKYKEIDYFKEIVYVLNSHIYWSNYSGKFKYKVLYNKHIEYIKKGFYNTLFNNIFNKYISTQTYFIYKYQSTDTSFIPNKLAKNLPRNKYYNNKKGIKISTIVDTNGIPLSLLLEDCNKHDSTLLNNVLNNLNIDTQPLKYKNANKYKQYFLADGGYDSSSNITLLKNKGYIPIIAHNKRNTKNINKIKKFTTQDKKIYKKRIIVENYFSWIKKSPKLMFCSERNPSNYLQLLLIKTSILIFNRFLNN